MAENTRVAVAILAAGSSQRFGGEDKLAADFYGTMLGLHAANAIPRAAFSKAWIIASRAQHPCAADWKQMGFELRENPRAKAGMGTSVALAASFAMQAEVDVLMIALADMPLVPRRHFAGLVEAAVRGASGQIAVSARGSTRMPPAIFGSDHFERLAGLDGESGARDLLAQGEVIDCPAEWLTDIDTPEALAAL